MSERQDWTYEIQHGVELAWYGLSKKKWDEEEVYEILENIKDSCKAREADLISETDTHYIITVEYDLSRKYGELRYDGEVYDYEVDDDETDFSAYEWFGDNENDDWYFIESEFTVEDSEPYYEDDVYRV